LIEAHRALPLAAAWGDGTTSSSDGQFFRTGGRGEAVGDVNARHGNEPGVAFYTHVSDQFGPFHTKVIAATASEAPHVLDGCCGTAPGCASPSTTSTPAVRRTRSSGCSPCSGSASRHACET
jgi:hypothetical protein